MPIKSRIRTVQHYPKQGVMFRDITTLLKDPVGFRITVHELANRYTGIKGTLKNPVFRRVLRVVDELLAGLYRHGSKMRVILYDSLCSVAVRPVFRRLKR